MRLVAIGDSFTCGEGVGVRVPAGQRWTELLAEALGFSHTSLATPGARVRNALLAQAPRAGTACVATVLVGLNDVARPGFHPDRVQADLFELVDAMRHRADVVLVGRLHDPTRVLQLPPPLRGAGRARAAVVNAAVDQAGQLSRVQVLDLAALPALGLPGAWDVDRVHPSPTGHRVLASAAGSLLEDLGLVVAPIPVGPVAARRPLVAQGAWLARHGAPYLARNLTASVARAGRAGLDRSLSPHRHPSGTAGTWFANGRR